MLYHSSEFAAFFAAVLLATYAAPRRLRPALLLGASYYFYADFEPGHLAILVAVTALCYVGGVALGRWPSRATLAASVAPVLGVLLWFKYGDFGLELTRWAVGAHDGADRQPLVALLPIGISFYTFQGISYLADVKAGRTKPVVHPLRLALFLSFFPQVLAGPIERADSLLPQLDRPRRPPLTLALQAAKLILWGLFCKLVLADKVALLIDPVYARPDHHGVASLVGAVLLYSFQIYFDFYGYTSVSIGLARLFGIELSPNFNHPYLAQSIRDFWRRWHITLTGWFRDYVYRPLGGQGSSPAVRYRNVLVVFALSGLWHGAALNFLLWGLLHGAFYVGGLMTAPARARAVGALGLDRFPRALAVGRTAFTFGLVSLAWIPFRVGDPDTLLAIGGRLIGTTPLAGGDSILNAGGAPLFLALLAAFFALDSVGVIRRFVVRAPTTPGEIALELTLTNAMLVALVLIGDVGARTYIYFQF